jgi:hypothetical protein
MHRPIEVLGDPDDSYLVQKSRAQPALRAVRCEPLYFIEMRGYF